MDEGQAQAHSVTAHSEESHPESNEECQVYSMFTETKADLHYWSYKMQLKTKDYTTIVPFSPPDP